MTKERRLAIAMWKYIRDNYDRYSDYISNHEDDDGYEDEDALSELKHEFLEGKNIKWAMNCWLCEYIGHRGHSFYTYSCKRCKLCPLKSCETGPYHTLISSPTQIQYIDACNQIIIALGGDV